MFAQPEGFPMATAPKTQRYQVRGKNASSYEYWVSLALEEIRLEYLFQVSYWGGRRMIGGIILDFLVFTKPLPTPLWVNGEYWHKGKQASREYYQQVALAQFGNMAPAIVLFGEECSTYEAALQSIRKEFRI